MKALTDRARHRTGCALSAASTMRRLDPIGSPTACGEKNGDILHCLGETNGQYNIPADGAKRLRGF